MLKRSLGLAAAFTLALSASALAAAKTGSYSGTSSNKEIYLYGDIEPRTDKGKVTFSVKSSPKRVVNFKLKDQQFMCGPGPHVVPVTVAKMKLNSSGRGKGTYKDPNVGEFKVAIKVTSTGRASGTITPVGLCSGVAKFSAKRR
jgi:hypothetical protein